MKALDLRSWQNGPAPEEVPVPSPGADLVIAPGESAHEDIRITRFELDQSERAYGLLRSGAVDGRVDVVPNGA